MAAWCRLGILRSWPAALQSRLSILQSRPVSPQSPPRRSSVLASTLISFALLSRNRPRRQRRSLTRPSRDQPVAVAEAPVAHRRIAPLLPPKSHASFAGFAPSRRFARCKNKKPAIFATFLSLSPRGWLQDGSGASREDNDASGGRLGPGDTLGAVPRTGDARASGGPAKRPAHNAAKTKSGDIQLWMPPLCFQTMLRLPSTYALL